MYPQAEIVYLKQDKIKQYLGQLIGEENTLLLEPNNIIEFREQMKQFKIDKVHSNELPSIKRINDYFKDNGIGFSIESVRKTLASGRYRCWEIQRHVS
ncbi:hypothetical protein [Viridibacillus arvi]|uniref:hypothetical protein n=1 Tax=Viridibacillus arvi TaxID=263475 RepID=UPI00187B4FF2|nr:hypothetical protein [Viridibacillus sp. JNUCC-6]QOV13201.1 hypothetical protein JNUCC6_10910 [Viridibacillus sp. JNUCC-6]